MAANPTSRLKQGFSRQAGFTLVELVATLLIIGMVASIAVAKMPSDNVFRDRAVVASVISLAAQARTTAVETQCTVLMDVSSSQIGMRYSNCDHNQGAALGGDGEVLSMTIEGGTFSQGQFSFKPSGEVSPMPAEVAFNHNVTTVINLMTLSEQ